MEEESTNETFAPIARPRRHIIVDRELINKSSYENVSIDLINKNIDIKNENLQNNTKNKLPPNKTFLVSTQSVSSTDALHMINVLTEMNDLQSTSGKDTNKNLIVQLDEVNNLNSIYNDSNIEESQKKPVPVPRRSNANTPNKMDLNSSPSTSGIISKVNNDEKTRESCTGSYSFINDETDSSELGTGKFSLRKTQSNSSLTSSQSGSSNNDGAKYYTSPPGQLLKALGATSKLLTESITERVSNRTKDAKTKIDKLKNHSRDRIAETTKSATNKLKSVRKNIHETLEMTHNLSLGRVHRNKSQKKRPQTGEYNLDRPQTVPINDEMFQSISFSSPLSCKTNNCSNINTAEASYEIPKNIRPISRASIDSTSSLPPPPYESLQIAAPRKGVSAPIYENNKINVKDKKMSVENPGRSISSDEENEYSVPCPSFPAPILNENIYGKLRAKANEVGEAVKDIVPIQPPMRTKRRKDYEQMQLRLKSVEEANSNRATVDSTDFADQSGRQMSENLSDKLRLVEATLPKPDRSESWSYYENSDDESSSPEPIYANQNTDKQSGEHVYGVIYNPDASEKLLLAPDRKRRSATKSNNVQYACIKKSPEKECKLSQYNVNPTDILKEFDPLDHVASEKTFTNKSNELILIENLLGEETYGTCVEENQFNYNSLETSSDDDDPEFTMPSPPERLDSLPESPNENIEGILRKTTAENNEENRRTVNSIIHQNPKLRSDSTDDLEAAASVEEEKLSKTRWFLPGSSGIAKSKSDKNLITDDNSTPDTDKRSSKSSMKSMFINVKNRVEGIKRKTSFRSSSKTDVKTILEMVPRPCLTQRLTLHEGHLIRLPNRQDILRELHSRKAYIRDKKFQAYCDKDFKTPKESIPIEWITTIQCVNEHKTSNNVVDIYSFEITTSNPKGNFEALSNPNIIVTSNDSGNSKMQRVCHVYGVARESERYIWMQKLLESITEVFPPGFSCRYHRAGWCYSKNSITSKWSGAWLLLQKDKRRLLFYNYQDMNLECMDLRKARCLVLKESDDSIKNLHVESGPILMIDCPPYAMYFIMSTPRETKIWRHVIQEVAHNNGPSLKEQQLTKDNVPVLVDKCINFIYAHGSMSEGIYRKSGSENSIQKLLNIFRTNAYSIQIIRSEYSEHDVANALKRFMRDMPERLLSRYTTSLISVSQMKDHREKIKAYKDLLSRLPAIENNTLKKLLGHLNFIQTLKESNKMDYSNLAIVWGPTLMQNVHSENQYSQHEAEVIIDLIKYYKNLYALTVEEVQKEQIMLTVLRKYHAAAENLSDSSKKSGDLMVWITIDASPDEKSTDKPQIHIKLTPSKTVNDIYKELAPKMKREAHTLTLSEMILDGALERPLQHSEKVFDIVLKWSYWPEDDRKNNYLLLRPMKLMKDIERTLKMSPTVALNKELKFADCKTKSLKSYTIELNDRKITVLKKEKNTIVKIREIDLLKVTAYLGCEKKRDFQLRWAITLIENVEKNQCETKIRQSPFIGHMIGGSEANDQIIWISSILHSIYGDDILPCPEIIIP